LDIRRETKVNEVALSSTGAKQILEKAGVDYCCGGEKSLREACAESKVSFDELMIRLQETAGQSSPAEAKWTMQPLNELTRHIVDKHHGYVREAILQIRPLLAKVKAKHEARHSELSSIESAFRSMADEMIAHMQKEEQILFPYIDSLAHAVAQNRTPEPPLFGTVRNPIQVMIQEHDSAGDLAKQIRNATSNYAPPADACPSFSKLYRQLQEFEADLHEHVHLENNVLFPRAMEMESAVR
jgi:regulator of cell morphogenesis and NO signaling